MQGFDYFKDVLFNKYAQFNGRARRSELWYFVLFNTIISWVFKFIDSFSGLTFSADIGILGLVYSIAVLIPGIAVTIRRLHDTNNSGWMYLLIFLPIIGWIWLLVLLVKDSEPGENQYGPNPKEVSGNTIQDNLV